jgi:hypothetical protein
MSTNNKKYQQIAVHASILVLLLKVRRHHNFIHILGGQGARGPGFRPGVPARDIVTQ